VVRARARVADDPARRERVAAVRPDLDRNLVVRAADAARLHLERGFTLFIACLRTVHRVLAGLLLDMVIAP
jgi:hypothetical protein